MSQYSEQDLKYASEFREGVHREALAIVRKTRPHVTEVVDRHPVEDYFQEHWDYPGRWYTIVAIPSGYGSRKALIDAIVRDTLSGRVPEKEHTYTQELRDMAKAEPGRRRSTNQLDAKPDDDPFYLLLAGYPDLAVDYCIVKQDGRYLGYESHRAALKTAWRTRFAADEDGELWQGSPNPATGKRITAAELFSSDYREGELNYRKAFLYPPHKNGYTGRDFVRVNAALFPKGTDGLEAYEWTTDWSDYFDDGREWWGTLCLTVYDDGLGRFTVIMASATD